MERLIERAKNIRNADLRKFVIDFLRNPVITFADVKPLISLEESPAAPKAHHSYPGGLIDHTLSVVNIGLALGREMETSYGIEVSYDYIIAGGLLHDIFKYYQYERDRIVGGFKPREDWFLAHDFAIIAEIAHRKGDDYLIRVISEIHGYNIISTPEGQILHLSDSIDSKFAGKIQDFIFRVCVDIERETDGRVLAIKLFNQLMEMYKPQDLIPYIKKGSEELRSFIKKVLIY